MTTALSKAENDLARMAKIVGATGLTLAEAATRLHEGIPPEAAKAILDYMDAEWQKILQENKDYDCVK